MPSNQSEVAVVAPVQAPLQSTIDYTLSTYNSAKDYVAASKTLSKLNPIINFGEETTVSILKKSPVAVEELVAAIDSRIEKSATKVSDTVSAVAAAPGKAKDKTLTKIHEKLNELKLEKDEEETPEVELATVATDAKIITAERLAKLLDASEELLQMYLAIDEEDKAEITVEAGKGELKPLALRGFKQTKVAAKRIQDLGLSKVNGFTEKTQGDVKDLTNNVKQTIYITLEKLDEKLLQPTKDVAKKGKDAVKNRVIDPASETVESITLPFKNRVVKVWTVVGEQYDQRVVQPREEIVKMFKEELQLQQQLAKEKSGEDLTIAAGLKAVVAAARARLSKEWQVRVSPALAKVLGRNGEYEEEEIEEKSFGDDEEESE